MIEISKETLDAARKAYFENGANDFGLCLKAAINVAIAAHQREACACKPPDLDVGKLKAMEAGRLAEMLEDYCPSEPPGLCVVLHEAAKRLRPTALTAPATRDDVLAAFHDATRAWGTDRCDTRGYESVLADAALALLAGRK